MTDLINCLKKFNIKQSERQEDNYFLNSFFFKKEEMILQKVFHSLLFDKGWQKRSFIVEDYPEKGVR